MLRPTTRSTSNLNPALGASTIARSSAMGDCLGFHPLRLRTGLLCFVGVDLTVLFRRAVQVGLDETMRTLCKMTTCVPTSAAGPGATT
jgi:hypothetical protein